MKEHINVAVLVSGGGTNLQALIDARQSGVIKSAEIKLVISNREGAFALERAKKHGIDNIVINDRGSLMEKQINEYLEKYDIDLIILAGFMSILSADFTAGHDHRIINIHPSLIPSFCGEGYYGLRVHEAALKKGVKVTGATVHFVNEIPDGGEIIMQKAVDIPDNITPEELQRKVMEEAEWEILPRACEQVASQIIAGKN